VLVGSSGFHLTLLYRLAHSARGHLGLPGKVLAAALFRAARHLYCCSLASSARLHGGLILPHPQGIVIGPGAEVGPWSYIYQNVTFGGATLSGGLPRVGRDARIYAGAVLAGPIRLGDRVQVGANAVIDRDVPADSFVRASPSDIGPVLNA
jgi:serine O-acetyltransferase